MILFITSMGLSGPIMVIISIVILVLTVTKSIQVFGPGAADRVGLERGLDAILFWGVFCAILGFWGQVLGHYKSLNVIIHAPVINPKLVFMGLAQCLTSTISGLTILLISSLVWFGLRAVVRRRSTRPV